MGSGANKSFKWSRWVGDGVKKKTKMTSGFGKTRP